MKGASTQLGVAVVGLGVGIQHALAYLETGRCRLRSLCDLDRDKARHWVRRLGAEREAGSFQEVLEDPKVDVVSIASFDDAHYSQVLEALNAGKHVFVEKPLCRTLREVWAIKAAWQRHKGRVHLASNLILRAAPLYRWLKQAIESGRLGTLYAIDGDYLYGRLKKITEGWRGDVKNYSVMLGGGVHMVDLMLWLTGQRPRTAYALGSRISSRGTKFRYDDFSAAEFRFPSGLVGRITANFGCVHRHQHVLRVFGTRATFLYDDAGARLHRSRNPASKPDRLCLAPVARTKGELIPEFVDSILHQRDTRAETRIFFDAISVCAAADASLRKKREVEIQYA